MNNILLRINTIALLRIGIIETFSYYFPILLYLVILSWFFNTYKSACYKGSNLYKILILQGQLALVY